MTAVCVTEAFDPCCHGGDKVLMFLKKIGNLLALQFAHCSYLLMEEPLGEDYYILHVADD